MFTVLLLLLEPFLEPQMYTNSIFLIFLWYLYLITAIAAAEMARIDIENHHNLQSYLLNQKEVELI